MDAFNFQLALPVIALAAYALLVLVAVPLVRARSPFYGWLALVGIAVAGWCNWRLWSVWSGEAVARRPLETAHGMVHIDGFGLVVSFLLLAVTALSVLVSMRFLPREDADHGEFYALMLFSAAGMLTMVNTRHLMMILIGLEVFSVALYVLTGLTRGRARSVESALKYFLLGAFSSGFLVYGMALLYGTAGSLDLAAIADAAADGPPRMFWIGLGLVLIGLFFKVAVVPFHQWVPDVYTGAPTNVTGFMAAATKTAAFAVLMRVLIGAFGDHRDVWVPLVTWIAILTMTLANLVALAQVNIKRLLAFSSIAHAGYLLIALVCLPQAGVGAIVFYLTIYALMTIGAFAIAAAVGRGDATGERGYDIYAWNGLGWKRPALGAAMTVFLLSMAGIPPTGGFLAKYVIFQAAVESKQHLLAVVGVLNAVVAAYYYLRVIVAMYMGDPEEGEEPLPVSPATAAVVAFAVAGILILGIAPGGLLAVVSELYTYVLTVVL